MGKVGEVDLWRFEREAREASYRLVAGVDEAGRGPLAGPVVAAAVMLPENFDLKGITDSKKLSAKARERAFAKIREGAVAVGVGIADCETIDRVNILQATFLAMKAALADMGAAFDYVLVDGDKRIPEIGVAQAAIVEGDALSASIAAASIIAKVTRDCIMVELAEEFPGYGFDRHKGYCTREHLAAIEEHGVCDVHRKSFEPICTKLRNQRQQRSLF
jgi:ribonuclease HII